MLFCSTRGLAPETNVRQVTLEGLAPDGGLYLPKEWPHFSAEEIAAFRGKSYQDIAFFALRPFLHGAVPDDVKKDLEGLQVMRTLGRNMAWFLKCKEAGIKAGIALPEREEWISTNFIR